MTDQKVIDERNKWLDSVVSHGPETAVSMLRGAYHSQCDAIDQLKKDLRELRQLFLNRIKPQLTVREAQLLNVCRICHRDVTGLFLLNYGEEFAHEFCVQEEKSSGRAGV